MLDLSVRAKRQQLKQQSSADAQAYQKRLSPSIGTPSIGSPSIGTPSQPAGKIVIQLES